MSNDSRKKCIREALMHVQSAFTKQQIQLFVLSGKPGNLPLHERGIFVPKESALNALELNVIVDDCCANELHKKAVILNGAYYYIVSVQASSYYAINPNATFGVAEPAGTAGGARQQPHGIIVVKTNDLITLGVYAAPTSAANAALIVENFAAKLVEGGH